MKIWTSEHIFNHPWETVTQAVWQKYPNPMNPSVVGMDVVERKVENGELYSHRLVTTKWGFPRWAEMILGPTNLCHASEHSRVNPHRKEMVLKTTNLTFCSFVAWQEHITYKPHPKDSEKTILQQDAVITVHNVPLTNWIENYITGQISYNATKGRQAIEWVVSRINDEVEELKKTTDGLIKSVDSAANVAKRSLDELQFIATPARTTASSLP